MTNCDFTPSEIAEKLRDEADFLEQNLLTGCVKRYVYGPAAATIREGANMIEKLLIQIGEH